MRRFIFSVLATVMLGSAVAQNTSTPAAQQGTRLTFKEAVKIGLQNNVLLNQQKNQLDYTQVNKTATLLQMGPTMSASANFYRTDGNSFNTNEGKVINGVIDYIGGSVNASMPVFAGFGYLNSARAAANANEAQLHQVARSNQDVIQLVASQYLTCMLDQELIKVNQENVNSQRVIYDQIKAQADLGVKPESDLFNQDYQVKNAELVLFKSNNQLHNDIATLALTIQVDPTVYLDVEPVSWDINQLLTDSSAYEDMYGTAVKRRSDLKQAEYFEKSTRLLVAAAKGRYYPNVFAGITYGSRYNYVQGETNRSFNDQFTSDNTSLNYGFSVNIPIFNGWLYKSQAAQNKVTYKNATVRRKNAEVTVKSDVVRAFRNFGDAKTTYLTSQSQLRAAELTYQMEKERYDLGMSNVVQLATVNQAYVKAQGDFQNAKVTLMFQKLLVSYAMGTLQLEDIP